MKQMFKTMCMLAIVALAFGSCKKSENNAAMFYGHTQELESDDSERAYIDGTSTMFEVGDQVMMYNINNTDPTQSYYGIYTATATGNATQFEFSSGNIEQYGARQDAFFAYYPAQNVSNSYLVSGGNLAVFTIPTEQTYRELNGVSIMPAGALAMASKDATHSQIQDAHFSFQNIMGAVNLKLYSNGNTTRKVESIVFEDNRFNITGDVHMKIHVVNPTKMTSLLNNYPNDMAALNQYIDELGYFVDGNKGKTITLNCGGVELTSSPKNFYIALRPLAMYAGFKVTVNFEGGAKAVITSTKNNMIKPNLQKNFSINVENYIQ